MLIKGNQWMLILVSTLKGKDDKKLQLSLNQQLILREMLTQKNSFNPLQNKRKQ